jgi:hypothetical protein
MALQPKLGLYGTSTEVEPLWHFNRSWAFMALQPKLGLYGTSTEVGPIWDFNRSWAFMDSALAIYAEWQVALD